MIFYIKIRRLIKIQIEVSDNTFEEDVINKSKNKPVVVDFWATWCGPCLRLGPILEKISKRDDRFILAKLNVDDNARTAQKYEVMSIPNVKMFKYGKIVDGFIGALSEVDVKKWLNKNLK